jgi:uncharacterized protein YegP (UPF0339 family)
LGIDIPAEFEIRNTVDGRYYWRFRAINGEVVAVSEVYESKQICKAGIDSIMSNAVFAAIRDQTL